MTSYSVMSTALMYYGLKCLLKQAYIVLPVSFSWKYTNINNKYGRTLSGLIGTAKHPVMQKIRIIGVSFENRLH